MNMREAIETPYERKQREIAVYIQMFRAGNLKDIKDVFVERLLGKYGQSVPVPSDEEFNCLLHGKNREILKGSKYRNQYRYTLKQIFGETKTPHHINFPVTNWGDGFEPLEKMVLLVVDAFYEENTASLDDFVDVERPVVISMPLIYKTLRVTKKDVSVSAPQTERIKSCLESIRDRFSHIELCNGIVNGVYTSNAVKVNSHSKPMMDAIRREMVYDVEIAAFQIPRELSITAKSTVLHMHMIKSILNARRKGQLSVTLKWSDLSDVAGFSATNKPRMKEVVCKLIDHYMKNFASIVTSYTCNKGNITIFILPEVYHGAPISSSDEKANDNGSVPWIFNDADTESAIDSNPSGYIYIISNTWISNGFVTEDAFPVKIGYAKNPINRISSLKSTSSIPGDWILHGFYGKVDWFADKRVHKVLDWCRIDAKKEWFLVSVEVAEKVIMDYLKVVKRNELEAHSICAKM